MKVLSMRHLSVDGLHLWHTLSAPPIVFQEQQNIIVCEWMLGIETTTQHMIVCTIDILMIIAASGCCQSSVPFTLSQYSTPLIAIELTLRVTKSNNVMSTLWHVHKQSQLCGIDQQTQETAQMFDACLNILAISCRSKCYSWKHWLRLTMISDGGGE